MVGYKSQKWLALHKTPYTMYLYGDAKKNMDDYFPI
jgi:hypothetical protein